MAHVAAIRGAIHEADPAQAVSAVGALEDDVARALARPRLQAALVAAFAIIARRGSRVEPVSALRWE